MYNSQINNSFNKIKTIWNIIKEETNRAQGTTNIILNNCQILLRPSTDTFCQSLETLLMILELTLTKVLVLQKPKLLLVQFISGPHS